MTIAEQLDLAIKLKETGTTDGAYVVELGNGKKHTKKTYMTKDECMNGMHSITERDAFSYGFRLGVQLMAESFLLPIGEDEE